MDAIKKATINLTDNDISIIEPIIERLNGLDELLIIVPDLEFELKAKIVNELSCLKRDEEMWMRLICNREGLIYPKRENIEIDFMDKIMTINLL